MRRRSAHPAPATAPLAARRRAWQAAQALGVPAGYGCTRKLKPQREPARLTAIGTDAQGRAAWLRPAAAAAWRRMQRAAAHAGITLQVVSAWRGYDYQLGILERKRAQGLAMDAILAVSAAPGYSEHHSGCALDLGTPGCTALDESFEHTPAFAWLQRHAGGFGFRLSYPRGNRHGIAYEPWHWRWRRR